jgi:hypothetical protein
VARVRLAGFVLCGIGLIVFYLGNVVQAFSGDSLDVPAVTWRAGIVVTTIGCVLLLGLLARPATRPARAVWEARFGFACLPAAILSLFGALGDGSTGLQPFWLIVTICLLPASVGVIALAAGVEREAKHAREQQGRPASDGAPGAAGRSRTKTR